MEHPDEGTIHAWLDDALPVEESAAIAAHVAECADCAASVAEARGFIAASSRIVSALDDVPRGVLPQREAVSAVSSTRVAPSRVAPSRAPIRPWWARPQLAAAALLVVVAGSLYSIRDRDVSVRAATYERVDSLLSGPALAPSDASTSSPSATSAPSPEVMSARSAVPANEPVAQQSAAPRALSERPDARREARKLEATMSAPISAPAAAPPPAPTSPVTTTSALADAGTSTQFRKSTANDAAGAAASSGVAGAASASAPPPSQGARRAPGSVTATGQSFTRAIPIAAGCYLTGTAGLPSHVVLTDSVAATANSRTWYRARPWPAPSAPNGAAEWRWAPLESTTAELLSIVRGDTTRYQVSTAARDATGCR